MTDSHSLYREIFDASHDAIFFHDSSGRILDVNRGMCQLFRCDRETALKSDVGELSEGRPPFDRDYAARKIEAALAGDPQIFEWRSRRLDGTVFWSEVSLRAAEINDRPHVVATVRDIDSRKNLETSLSRERALRESMISAVPGLFSVFDHEGKLVYWNKGYEEVSGYSGEELEGSHFSRFFAEDSQDLQRAQESYVLLLQVGFVEAELEFLTKEGAKIPFFFTGSTFPVGDRLFFCSMGVDVSRRKQAERDRREFERQFLIAQKAESLGTMAAGIAHDFNNILFSASGNIELAMVDIDQPSEPAATLEKALQACNRGRDLVRQLMTYAGQVEPEAGSFSLQDLIRENAGFLRASIPPEVALDLDLGDDDILLEADQGQVQQIVMNLILNAGQAVGDRPGTIRLTTGAMSCCEGDLEREALLRPAAPGPFHFLEIADDGCGMAEEVRKRIMDPFFTTKDSGRGLGLSAVLGIVRGMGGAVLCRSREGEGTTFTILFPGDPGDGVNPPA